MREKTIDLPIDLGAYLPAYRTPAVPYHLVPSTKYLQSRVRYGKVPRRDLLPCILTHTIYRYSIGIDRVSVAE